MCVIIHRPAALEIPFNKLKVACQKNNDGFGISVFDRGKLEIRRVWEPKGNDPELLAKMLEEAKDHEVFVHLRLRSVGNISIDNVHPFLFIDEDNRQYALMHNGTMQDYNRGKGRTDSEVFAQEIVKPLVNNWKNDNPLLDEDFKRLVRNFAGVGTYNKIVVMNNLGSSVIVNKDAGCEVIPGVWASNAHSFEDYASYSYGKGGSSSTVPFRSTTQSTGTTKGHGGGNDATKATTAGTAKPEEKPVLKAVPAEDIKAKPRDLFIDKAGLNSLEEAAVIFTEHDIRELVENYPDDAVSLILDLLDEIYWTQVEDGDEVVDDDKLTMDAA